MDKYFWKKSIIRQIEQWNIGCIVGNKKMEQFFGTIQDMVGFCKTDILCL